MLSNISSQAYVSVCVCLYSPPPTTPFSCLRQGHATYLLWVISRLSNKVRCCERPRQGDRHQNGTVGMEVRGTGIRVGMLRAMGGSQRGVWWRWACINIHVYVPGEKWREAVSTNAAILFSILLIRKTLHQANSVTSLEGWRKTDIILCDELAE